MMRLLERVDAGEFQLVTFSLDVPCYAVLSHTWGAEEDEVSFDDLLDGTAKTKPGYDKLEFCANQAWYDGLRFFWIDTCCIDKSNAAELQDAVQSMFRWYHDAARCYVYLSDVSAGARPNDFYAKRDDALRRSRWFTRGWTLQELIAPPCVKFFSKEAAYLGNREALQYKIHDITGIPLAALANGPLSAYSVAERLAWARHRQTARAEDRAYALQGLLGVVIPLRYGEGEEEAFRRLHAEMERVQEAEAQAQAQALALAKDRMQTKTIKDEPLRRVPGYLYIAAPANYFDAADGYYVGEAGKWCVNSVHVPISDALGNIPVVEPVGGCKTVVHCNVAPPVSMASGQTLCFVPDK